jgi:uncharacterized protein (TIGR00251 family)
LLVAVRVTPKSSRDAVTGLHTAADGAVSLAVRVTAAPEKGRANAAVIALLARASGLSKSAFALVSGETERCKTILVTGNPATFEAWMASIVNAGKES